MATFHLQIVTPDRMVFDGQAERVIVRTAGGDVCILPRHIDYMAPLGIGQARVTDAQGNTRCAACRRAHQCAERGSPRFGHHL